LLFRTAPLFSKVNALATKHPLCGQGRQHQRQST